MQTSALPSCLSALPAPAAALASAAASGAGGLRDDLPTRPFAQLLDAAGSTRPSPAAPPQAGPGAAARTERSPGPDPATLIERPAPPEPGPPQPEEPLAPADSPDAFGPVVHPPGSTDVADDGKPVDPGDDERVRRRHPPAGPEVGKTAGLHTGATGKAAVTTAASQSRLNADGTAVHGEAETDDAGTDVAAGSGTRGSTPEDSLPGPAGPGWPAALQRPLAVPAATGESGAFPPGRATGVAAADGWNTTDAAKAAGAENAARDSGVHGSPGRGRLFAAQAPVVGDRTAAANRAGTDGAATGSRLPGPGSGDDVGESSSAPPLLPTVPSERAFALRTAAAVRGMDSASGPGAPTLAPPGDAARPGAEAFAAALTTALGAVMSPGTAAATPPATEGRLLGMPGTSPFAAELGAQLTTFVRDGVQHARLELNPAEMGPLTVRIEIDGPTARLHLGASHAATRQALEQALPVLAGNLREAGLTLAGGGVFDPPQQRPQDGEPNPGRPGGDGGARNPGRPAADGDVGSATPTAGGAAARPWVRPRGVVDLVA